MISIGADYSWVLFTTGVIATQCLLDGFQSSSLRKKFFNKAFFEKHFPELKDSYPKGGYPDMGNGLFAHKLNVHDWMAFNSVQRAHYNGLEQLATVMFMVLTSGLVFPRYAVILGWAYIIGRLFYSIGYRRFGPSGRVPGAVIQDISGIALIGLSFYSLYTAGGGVQGFTKFIQG